LPDLKIFLWFLESILYSLLDANAIMFGFHSFILKVFSLLLKLYLVSKDFSLLFLDTNPSVCNLKQKLVNWCYFYKSAPYRYKIKYSLFLVTLNEFQINSQTLICLNNNQKSLFGFLEFRTIFFSWQKRSLIKLDIEFPYHF